MQRYTTAVLTATLTYGVVFLSLIASQEAWRGRPVSLGAVLPLVIALTIMNGVVFAMFHGPVLLWLRRSRVAAERRLPRALLVASLSLVSALTVWAMFRESNETVMGYVAWARNVPAEFLLNFAPQLASVSLLVAWLLSPAGSQQPATRASGE